MSYNVNHKAYEKSIWMKVGSQFKFIVNKENKVSPHYPAIYVYLICIIGFSRISE